MLALHITKHAQQCYSTHTLKHTHTQTHTHAKHTYLADNETVLMVLAWGTQRSQHSIDA
jgi:hypothetical protein